MFFILICLCFSSPLIPETWCLEALRPFTRHGTKRWHHRILFCELRDEFNWTKNKSRTPNHFGNRHHISTGIFSGDHQSLHPNFWETAQWVLRFQELALLALLRGSRGGAQQKSPGEISGTFGACNPPKASPAWLGGWHQLHEGPGR